MDDAGSAFQKEILIELGSTALQGVLFPFGIKARQVKPLGPGKTRPVVLIHGYGGNRSCLLPLEGVLRTAGFDRVFPFSYPGDESSIDDLAGALKAYIGEVRAACGAENQSLDLVAYSLGGLVARVFLQELGGAAWVDQCLTLGTPHYGTYSSFWAPTPIGRQMRPDSEFMARLNDPARRAPGVRYLSLWAERDLMVLPRENAVYREGDGQRINRVGHLGILTSPLAFGQVIRRLRSGQVLPVTPVQRLVRFGQKAYRVGSALVETWRSRSRDNATGLPERTAPEWSEGKSP
jgi:triacylglycerol esterase/lipase EstA (alpha/beta hydrolase family)